MASQMRRRSSAGQVDRASVHTILTPVEVTHPSPVPTPHVGMSPSRSQSDMPPPPRPTAKHSRASSFTPRNPNRLSLSFPVATGASTNDSPRPTPTSSKISSFPPTPIEPSPNDPSGLFVAMAAQERRVLEIKEELQKAETELRKLKSQWQAHERKRKLAELRHAEPLQALQAIVPDSERSSEDSDGMRQSLEIEKRKSLILQTPKESRRKKFSGSHTRALSLLSPERSNFTQPFPPVREFSTDSVMGLPTPRSTTSPDPGTPKISANRARHSYQSGVTHGAKQIAEDLKSGMWTFFEDLRQATIGDEAISASPNRLGLDLAHKPPQKKVSKGSLRGNKNRHSYSPGGTVLPRTWDTLTGSPNLGLGIADAGGQLWPGPPSRSPSKSPSGTLRKKTSRHLSFAPVAVDDVDDDWTNWDSPTPKSPRWSGSTDISGPATPSHDTSEERPIKIVESPNDEASTPSKQREDIQWPALETFTPGNLKRTMSTLMQEWEKTLTPPPERQHPLSRQVSPSREASKEPEHSLSQMPLL